MSYGTDSPAPDSVEVGKFLSQPPGIVWHAITDPPMLERWLMKPVGFDATVGTGFVFAVCCPSLSMQTMPSLVLPMAPMQKGPGRGSGRGPSSV